MQAIAARIEKEDPQLKLEKNAKLKALVQEKFQDRIEI